VSIDSAELVLAAVLNFPTLEFCWALVITQREPTDVVVEWLHWTKKKIVELASASRSLQRLTKMMNFAMPCVARSPVLVEVL
jgi:hypothetical protein